MSDLRALIEAVEAGGDLPRPLPFAVSDAACIIGAYNGSLDAALALHEELLGYDWGIASFSLNGEVSVKRNRPLDVQYGFADMDPARAWLLAILRAKEAGHE